ncbi:hypothetical protein BJ170DRAFT_594914 [Xylariales sp. AK1849]|nr:hypothetical protein BJ170DRAFT_594914 [Xylariales sp. AK1849]
MAPLCRFYQQANCRFEHPGANPNPFGGPSNNRFNALSTGAGGGGSNNYADGTYPYQIKRDAIKIDLLEERPSWILSSYGPGKDAPAQLFGGFPREQSFEEIRLSVVSSADQQQALQQVQGLYQQAEQQMQASLNDLPGAVKFMVDQENNHPNRIDICNQNTQQGGTNGVFNRGNTSGGFSANPLNAAPIANQNPFATTQASAFGAPATTAPATSAFGAPSTLGSNPNPFGAPSQLGITGGSAFGQPTPLGSTGGSAFGAPSQVGATGGSAFGQPSQLGAGVSTFGAPSALGAKPNPFAATTNGPSGFAAAAQQSNSAFGQVSALGQAPNPFGAASASPFGAPAQPQNRPSPSPFGASAQPQTGNSPSPFGAPAQPRNGAVPHPFGAPTQPQNAAPAANPFGKPAQPSAFGALASANPFSSATSMSNDQAMDTSAPPPTPGNSFGKPTSNGFGAPTNNGNTFGGAAPSNTHNAFGAPQQRGPSAQAGPPSDLSKSPYPPGSSKVHPPIESYATLMGTRVIRFKGQPVAYKDRTPGIQGHGNVWQKIWFPDGAPGYYGATQPEQPKDYTEGVRKAYEDVRRNGNRFVGDMPTVPPMREDCVWDF